MPMITSGMRSIPRSLEVGVDVKMKIWVKKKRPGHAAAQP
jgi:hypothetical protein